MQSASARAMRKGSIASNPRSLNEPLDGESAVSSSGKGLASELPTQNRPLTDDVTADIRLRQHEPRLPATDSTSSIESLRSQELERLAESFLYRQKKVSRSQSRVLSLRDRLLYDREQFSNNRRWLQDSQKRLMDAINDVVFQRGPSSRNAYRELNSLYDQAHLDQRVLLERANKLQVIEDRLGGLENILEKRRQKLADATQQMVDALGKHFSATGSHRPADDCLSDTSAESVLTSDAISDDGNPILNDYYDKAGHLKNMRERYANVQMEYEEALTQRVLMEDQEKVADVTEAQFQLYWKTELDDAYHELEEAERADRQAKQNCIAAGFSPYVGEEPPVEVDSASSCDSHVTETPREDTLIVHFEKSPLNQDNEPHLPYPEGPLREMHYPAAMQPPDSRIQSWIAELGSDVPQSRPGTGNHRAFPKLNRRSSNESFRSSKDNSSPREDATERMKMNLYLNDLTIKEREPHFERTTATYPPRTMSDSQLFSRARAKVQRQRNKHHGHTIEPV